MKVKIDQNDDIYYKVLALLAQLNVDADAEPLEKRNIYE